MGIAHQNFRCGINRNAVGFTLPADWRTADGVIARSSGGHCPPYGLAIGLLAFVLSGLFAKFVSLGSAPLVFLMACILLDLVDSRRRRRRTWRFGGRQPPGDVASRGRSDRGDNG